MNNIQIFQNLEFGKIRSTEKSGEVWFVGKDICAAFGDKNHNRSLGRVDDEDKSIVQIIDSLGRPQVVTVVNESGVYSLLFAMQPQKVNNGGVSDAYPIEVRDRIEKLRRFQRWVTHEVLPSIREHGYYMTPETLQKTLADPDSIIQLATSLKSDVAGNKKL